MLDKNRRKDSTEIAILLDDYVNKYHPGVQTFRLQVTSGLQGNSRALYREKNYVDNIMNKDTSAIKVSEVSYSAVVKLPFPREITRNYPKKYIPAGTRVVVQFISGDITKPQIIAIEQ